MEGAKVGADATFIEHITNEGYQTDTYVVRASGGGWTATVYDATCTTPLTTTPSVAAGDTVDVCVKVAGPGDGRGTPRRTTRRSPRRRVRTRPSPTPATLTTIAVAFDTLLVDNDTNAPIDSAPYYENALDANERRLRRLGPGGTTRSCRRRTWRRTRTSSGSPATPTRRRSDRTSRSSRRSSTAVAGC